MSTRVVGVTVGLCRSSIEDLKREHETDRQHLMMLHSEELEAVKAAHSHTRCVLLLRPPRLLFKCGLVTCDKGAGGAEQQGGGLCQGGEQLTGQAV